VRLLGTPAEERFDKITRLARRMFGVPISSIDIVGEKRAWLKSVQGLDRFEVARECSYCQYAILGEGLYVPDTQLDARFSDNPFAHAGAASLRFFAGYSLQCDGENVGVMCIADTKPRTLSDEELGALRDLADLAEHEMLVGKLSEAQLRLAAENVELTERASVDLLTRFWNRGAILDVLKRELVGERKFNAELAVLIVDIDHFKTVNDHYGHAGGDSVLRDVSARMRRSVRPYDAIGRYGGEEFLAVLPACGVEGGRAAAERLRAAIEAKPFDVGGRLLRVTASVGVTVVSPGEVDVGAVIARADAALYDAKHGGRNRIASSIPTAA
jgi:diguanylate cyclase (GGDEF)-like protein